MRPVPRVKNNTDEQNINVEKGECEVVENKGSAAE